MDLNRRLLESQLIKKLNTSSSVVLLGPRQVGKTTLLNIIQSEKEHVYLDLENNIDLNKISDVHAYYKANEDKLIILDEIQRAPEIFTQLRGIIDQKRRKGNKTGLFLFSGSASLDLLKQSSESLAGRTSYLELYPFNLLEVENDSGTIGDLWLKGGFPDSYLASDKNDSLEWRIDFIKTYLERDIPQLGPRIPAETLSRFWTMLAHQQGEDFNASSLARGLEVKSPTVSRYADLFVDLLLVRRLTPYYVNVKKRLVKSPRLYIRDSGVCHALLNISSYNELLGHPVVGKSWEGFVIENIASVLPKNVNLHFYRTSNGAEIDLVIDFKKELWAVEIKRSPAASLSKGFHIACTDIKAKRKILVHGGEDNFPLPNSTEAFSLKSFMEMVFEE